MTKSTSQMKIAVTGATGYVGRFVVDELQARGAMVRALARPQTDRTGFRKPIDWVDGDLRANNALRALVDGVDGVVHLAYEHLPGRYRGGEGDDLPAWLEANVLGSLRLLSFAAEASVRRFVFLSSRAVHSTTETGRLLDETHPVSPDTHYGAYKAAVEAFLRSFRYQHGMLTFGVRATGVYGVTRPIERSKWWELILSTLEGKIDTRPKGGTEVFGGDVARTVWALLSHPDDIVGKLNVVHLSDLYVTNADIVRLTRRIANLAPQPTWPQSSSPSNPLECTVLRDLGIQLGGITRLEATVEELVKAAQISKATTC
jgi:nucleoside-diphosphate-sugar epimerase